MNPTRVADLTVDELIAIVKQAVWEAYAEIRAESMVSVAAEPDALAFSRGEGISNNSKPDEK